MNKFKSKKGFTLAELLIVVAIIAVLIAIAVPLFVGALDKAERRVFESNQKSIADMGIVILLTSNSKDLDLSDPDAKYYASATVDNTGKIGEVTVTDKGTKSEYDTWKTNKNQPIVAEITATQLGEYTKTSVSP